MADTRDFEQACDNSVNKMQELLMQNMELTLDHIAEKAKEKVGVDRTTDSIMYICT